MATRTVAFEIKRQASPDAPAVWENFELEWRPGMNVVSAMMEIAANPVTADGRPTTPITYDSNCLEEICGSCAMRVNGKARMGCSALVDNLEQPIRVEPLSKFPLVRDLQVDRNVLFENLMAVKAWVPVDGTYDLGSGPRVYPQQQEANYPLSNCISCCCCMDVCPQFNLPASSARPPSPRSSSLTITPPARSSRKTACARWPATAASRSAASPRTASIPAPSRFR